MYRTFRARDARPLTRGFFTILKIVFSPLLRSHSPFSLDSSSLPDKKRLPFCPAPPSVGNVSTSQTTQTQGASPCQSHPNAASPSQPSRTPSPTVQSPPLHPANSHAPPSPFSKLLPKPRARHPSPPRSVPPAFLPVCLCPNSASRHIAQTPTPKPHSSTAPALHQSCRSNQTFWPHVIH